MTKTNVKSSTRGIKSGMTVKSKKFDTSDNIKPTSEKEIQALTVKLGKMFENFEKNNEAFNFQETIIDEDGNEATIGVDFGVEDFEDNDGYAASVIGTTKNNKPFDDWTDVDAFDKASDIVDLAKLSLSFYDKNYAGDFEWDTDGSDMHNPNKGMVDATMIIRWR